MHKLYLQDSIQLAKNMIHAFYIEGDVDKVLSYVNQNNFTWVAGCSEEIFTDLEEIRNFFNRFVDFVREKYKIHSEKYSIGGSSEDSCIVVAIINFHEVKNPSYDLEQLTFSFYIQRIDKKLVCSSYHVHNATQNSQASHYQYFHNNDLKIDHPLVSINNIAVKSFVYNDQFPYVYINLRCIELFGYKKVQEFLEMSQKSSLAQIHPKDQPRYIQMLEQCKSKMPRINSYCISYQTQSFIRESQRVLEWGMLSAKNDQIIVTAIIFPVDEVDESNRSGFFFQTKLGGGGDNLQPLSSNYGIHVGNSLVIYQRQRQVEIDGNRIDLTPVEFELLLMFVDNLNNPIPPSKFYSQIWKDETLQVTSNTLKMHLSNLRRKLKITRESQIQLNFCRNEGYCLSLKES